MIKKGELSARMAQCRCGRARNGLNQKTLPRMKALPTVILPLICASLTIAGKIKQLTIGDKRGRVHARVGANPTEKPPNLFGFCTIFPSKPRNGGASEDKKETDDKGRLYN